ncbi:sugar phosphate isomerase/epimerase family protein [Sphingobacterium spiritivorum]|uniref:sugar phosphate isomerase/epimerase family protein n=1 Tax=Sphingobacterium spiritivorum TaxID=258 RepID=UPI00191ACDFB|nr:sugar phosphate isomerase/epimerase [Sphingobacterium spiritivorum]QQT26982.1 sugar phosphate isomerase/epimerase [Sphingobacterium spiritivorum]
MNKSRRKFLKQAGVGVSAAFLSPYLLSCESKKIAEGPFQHIGIQLYTLRDELAKDAKGTIEKIAKIGYKHVETFGVDVTKGEFFGLPIKDFKKVLEDNNLVTHSGHYDLSKYLSKNHEDKESIERYVEIAKELGQSYVVAPVTPMFDINALKSADYQYAAEQLNKAGEISKKSGIKMGYHNHFWEFRDQPNGTKGLDILIAFTEPELVDFELDLYWIEKSGLSPQSYFEKYPNRFSMWHVKDMDKAFTKPIVGGEQDKLGFGDIIKEIKYAEVGTGNIDFTNIVKYADKSGLKYAFVEQDDIYMADKFASIQKSYDYVENTLSKIK